MLINEDNRQKILDCALVLFAEYGYDAVGVQRIVEEAAVTKPTLYHHFGSKNGLLATLLKYWFDDMFRRIEPAADYAGDLTLTLTRIMQAYFTYATNAPTFYRLQLTLWFAPIRSEAYRSVYEYNERQHQLLEAVFRAATVQHGNMHGRHTAYAATFLGMINTCIGLYLNNYLVLDENVEHKLLHQFMHGIFS